jgi:hypothetical protein
MRGWLPRVRRVRAHILGWLRPAVLVAAAAVAGIAVNVVLLGFGPPATDRVGKFRPELELAAPASAQAATPTRRDDAGRKEQRRTVVGETSTTATASEATPTSTSPIAPALDDTSGLATRDQQPGASDDD